jgi:hypothetical protein
MPSALDIKVVSCIAERPVSGGELRIKPRCQKPISPARFDYESDLSLRSLQPPL